MTFTRYYYQLGYQMEKKAGIFTDDKGNLTTGTKIGLGALGLGAAGLLGHHYLSDGQAAAESLADNGDFIREHASGGLMGDVKAGGHALSDAANYLKAKGSDAIDYLKDEASQVGSGAKAMAHDVMYRNPHATPEMAEKAIRGIQEARANQQAAREAWEAGARGLRQIKELNQ